MTARPTPVHTSRSFSRLEPGPSSPIRKRASTMQETGIHAVPEAREIGAGSHDTSDKADRVMDVFENGDGGGDEDDEPASGRQAAVPGAGSTGTATDKQGPDLQLPSTFDELPIEIRSLTERFLESLSAKVHPQPLSADALSELFQDFYERAASHIATHIATLTSRIGREKSPVSSTSSSSLSSKINTVKSRSRAGSGAKRGDVSTGPVAGGEMLTATEVADRKKARRLLELKRVALEEAVERAVTERVYERIWKHRSTDDDARDEKLRSKTAALSLVGIGLRELHMDSKEDVRKATEEKEEEIHLSLTPARDALQKMDGERFPLGKLRCLTEAHKSIVETLSQVFPSSSSADEILPTLIYTLITSPPEGINAISNLNFIQRFRTADKIDGEAAYCLVNLEAAISFLETVDLSSLRADELPEGPPKAPSQPSTPSTEQPPSLLPPKPAQAQTGVSQVAVHSREASNSSNGTTEPASSSSSSFFSKQALQSYSPKFTTPPRPQLGQRRISAIMQAQATAIEARRDNFLNAADKVYESINGTLDNSFQFVFGRFKDQNKGNSPLPKTLEEARKLVNSPNVDGGEDEDALSNNSGRSSPAPTPDESRTSSTNNKMVELIGGRKAIRDRSADSARSGGSNSASALGSRRPAAPTSADNILKARSERESSATAAAATNQHVAAPPNPANLFSSMTNPLTRFNVPTFPRFGRAASVPAGAAAANNANNASSISPPPSAVEKAAAGKLADISESSPPAATASSPALVTGAMADPEKGGVTGGAESAGAIDDEEGKKAREVLAELKRTKPPRKRFLDVQSAAELRIGEVEELLLEYRRLAKAIGLAVAT